MGESEGGGEGRVGESEWEGGGGGGGGIGCLDLYKAPGTEAVLSITVLIVTVSHRTFPGQFRHLSGLFSPLFDQINTSGYVMPEHFQWLTITAIIEAFTPYPASTCLGSTINIYVPRSWGWRDDITLGLWACLWLSEDQ